jgi:hypothetical protein
MVLNQSHIVLQRFHSHIKESDIGLLEARPTQNEVGPTFERIQTLRAR